MVGHIVLLARWEATHGVGKVRKNSESTVRGLRPPTYIYINIYIYGGI